MARRRIVWTEAAEQEKDGILEYWANRNKSKTYSKKLFKKIQEHLKLIAVYPKAGKETQIKNVRYKVMGDYSIIYEILDNEILVHSIWDDRQDPKKSRVSKK